MVDAGEAEQPDPALMVTDESQSPLNQYSRGTYLKIQFSQSTRPKSLSKVAGTIETSRAGLLRTKTAIGQVLMGRKPLVAFKVKLNVTEGGKTKTLDVEPDFYLP